MYCYSKILENKFYKKIILYKKEQKQTKLLISIDCYITLKVSTNMLQILIKW